MASMSEPKSSFSENYAKGNIDTTCDVKSWILCKKNFPDPITDSCFVDVIDVTLAVEENKSKLVNEVAELTLMVVLM